MREAPSASGMYEYKGKLHRDNFPREGGMRLNRLVRMEAHGIEVKAPGNWKAWLDKAYPGWASSAKPPSYLHKANRLPCWDAKGANYDITWLYDRK